jgi:fructosamine-3-kinase
MGVTWLDPLQQRIESILGATPTEISLLSNGRVGKVFRVHLSDGETVVAKADEQINPCLETEATMLRYLTEHSNLPVPAVLFADDRLLLMTYLPGDNVFNAKAQGHAAELMAELHSLTAFKYGFECETLIGGLLQPNPRNESWLDFFREQRILYMAREGVGAGRLPNEMLARLGKFCLKLDQWLEEPQRACLIHGDAWTGNILALGDRITGFLDPAIYYGDSEIELAFTTLFGTFDRPFFKRYDEIRPLRPGFMEVRRDVYNLYPLLVHVRLFGGSYVASVDRILQRFGF